MIQMEFILTKMVWINQAGTMTKKEYTIPLLNLLNLKTSPMKPVKKNSFKIIKRLNQIQMSMRISSNCNKNKSMSTMSIKFSFLKYKEQNLMKLDSTNFQVELSMILLATISMRADMMQQEDTTIKKDNI